MTSCKVELENLCNNGRPYNLGFLRYTQTNLSPLTKDFRGEGQLDDVYRRFFLKLKGYVTPKYEVILGGDFNMVENLTMDRQGGNPNRQHLYGLEELNEIKQNCNLTDIWRTQNKFKMKFTYENGILDFKSRIWTVCLCGTKRKNNLVSALILYKTNYQTFT